MGLLQHLASIEERPILGPQVAVRILVARHAPRSSAHQGLQNLPGPPARRVGPHRTEHRRGHYALDTGGALSEQ